jgi:hypothetical protein
MRMKKIYLFLIVTVLAFAGSRNVTFAGNTCSTVIETFDAFSPTSSLYPFGIVSGTYSGSATLNGSLFYEGSFLQDIDEQFDGLIFLSDLLPGSYEFVYCGGSQFFTIDPLPCDISFINLGTTDVSGAGCTPNGAIDVTVGSSTPGQTFYYVLTDLATFNEISGQDDGFGIISIQNLAAGLYTLFVSTEPDVLSSTCNVNDLILINEPACDMAIPTSSATDATTQGGTDGSISITVTGSSCIPSPPGGSPIYEVYAELNGSFYADLTFNAANNNYELSGLAAGTYTVIASNGGSSCFASTDIVVGEPTGCNLAAPTVFATNTVICNGAPAILSVPSIYATYQWVYNGSVLIPVTGLQHTYWAYLEGNYSVVVSDINGCTATSNSVFVEAPLSPEINFPDTFYSCEPTITLTAPSAFDTYLWSNYDTTSTITITTDGWYGLAAGVDALVCGVVDSFYVSLNNVAPIADITLIGNNPFCVGTTVTLQSNSAVNNTWSTNENTQSIVVSQSGNYTLEVTNTIGCTATASIDLVAQNCVPGTQLANGVCGNLGYVRTSAISCVSVAGATQYEWEFSNGNGVYAVKLSPVNYIALHGVTPILNWGTTWSVRVRAYIGANAGTYSNACTIGIIQDPAIGGVPTTQLRSQDCGKLNYRINADNRLITTTVSGAIQYEFEFSLVGSGTVVANVLRPNTVLFLNTMVPTLAFGQYNVRTRARIGTTWGAFGPVCLIQIIGLNREEAPVVQELEYGVDAPYFDLTAMPNPYEDVTSIVINSSINENVYVQFYDMTGKLVEDIKATTNERFNVGSNLSKGIYLLKARSDSGNQVTTRLVKTN